MLFACYSVLVCMLVIDGARYLPWTPKDEEKEFHPLIKKQSKEIFGKNSIYFDVKTTIKTASGIGSIPDAYVININEPVQWYVVENELATHPVYDHIVKQLSKFINGIDNQNSRTQILEILYDKINADEKMRATITETTNNVDLHHFLAKLLTKPPRIVVIIDKKTLDVEEACLSLKYVPTIIEFKSFVREDDPKVFAHLFEPIVSDQTTVKNNINLPNIESINIGTVTPHHEYTMPILESLIELGGSARAPDVIARVYEKMRTKLKEKDYQPCQRGMVQWKYRVNWQRTKLRNIGYLKKDSPFGVWEITEEGRKYYESLKEA